MEKDRPRPPRSAARVTPEHKRALKAGLDKLHPPVGGDPFAPLLRAIDKATRKK